MEYLVRFDVMCDVNGDYGIEHAHLFNNKQTAIGAVVAATAASAAATNNIQKCHVNCIGFANGFLIFQHLSLFNEWMLIFHWRTTLVFVYGPIRLCSNSCFILSMSQPIQNTRTHTHSPHQNSLTLNFTYQDEAEMKFIRLHYY